MHDQDDGVARQKRDRREILDWIVAEHRAGMRRNHQRGFGRRQERVAVGIRLGDERCADAAGSASAVLDHERLAQRLLQMRLEETRDDVGAATGRKRHNDAHRAVRIGGLR